MKIANYLETRAQLKLWSIRPGESLFCFADVLRERGVGALTVLDDWGVLVGVVSERDLVAAFAEHFCATQDMTVADIMTREVITCTPKDDMLETLEKMNKHNIRHIPVMKNGRPVTMISIREFDAACRELKDLALNDALTGIPNRRHFLSTLEKEILRHRRFGVSLTVAVMDLDRFENINEIYGREAADEALIWFARLLTEQFRTFDGVGRLDGQEFGVIFPNTGLGDATEACERLSRAVRTNEAPTSAGDIRLTVSQGVTTIDGELIATRDLITKAEALLYEAKTSGRDLVMAEPYRIDQCLHH